MAELFDMLFARGRVMASRVAAGARAVLVNVTGVAQGMDPTTGEGSTGEALFGQIGIVARPRAPSADGHAEVISARTGDGLQPIAGRDLRLNSRVNPADGEIDLVSYGGGFLSLADNADGKGTTAVLFAPALKTDGTVDKAHAVTLDTSAANLSLSLVHALGMALLLTKEKSVILKNAAGDAYLQIDDSGITLNGNVKLNGGIVAGSIVSAQPLLQSVDMMAWVAQANGVFAALAAAAGSPLPPTTAPSAVPKAATKASAS